MSSVPAPQGVNRLMDEAEQAAREMVRECVLALNPYRPPDAGSIAIIRRTVEDAAHLQDDLLGEVLTVLERDGDCERDISCDLEAIEAGRGCWYCHLVYRLRCAGVEPVISWHLSTAVVDLA